MPYKSFNSTLAAANYISDEVVRRTDLKRHKLYEPDYTCPMNTNKTGDRGASSSAELSISLPRAEDWISAIAGGFIIANY